MSSVLWNYPAALVDGVLLRREKRFTAFVTLSDGSTIQAHCPNPGRLQGLCSEGTPVRCEPLPPSAQRRNLWRWVQAFDRETGCWVGVNPLLANTLAERAVSCVWPDGVVVDREISDREGSRWDLLVEHGGDRILVEVKSVTLRRAGALAEFPDAVSARATKHCQILARIAQGMGPAALGCVQRAAMLFVVQRADARSVGIACDIDPRYGRALTEAVRSGVAVRSLGVDLDARSIRDPQLVDIVIS